MRSATRHARRTLVMVASALVAMVCIAHAQTKGAQPWEVAAGGSRSFEVASVRQNRTENDGGANVDLLAGDTFTPTGGLYSAKNIGLPQLISFAYKLPMDQFKTLVEQVPWLADTRYDIEARAPGDPTKDQYRLMMQSLLGERFKLKVHYETRQLPVYEVKLIKAGRWGPKLRPHLAEDQICRDPPLIPPSGKDVDAEGYPLFCGRPSRIQPSVAGGLRFGGRDVTMAQFVASPMRVMADVSRPLVDATGIQEAVDFTIEWALAARNIAGARDFHPDESLPDFDEALSQQLGLRLVSGKGPVALFVIDHVEPPNSN